LNITTHTKVCGLFGLLDAQKNLTFVKQMSADFSQQFIFLTLEKGINIVLNRFIDSTTAYQGYGNGIPLNIISVVNDVATDGIKPDLTYILDMPAEKALSRINKAEFGQFDRIELKGKEYLEKVRQGYLEIVKKESERCVLIPYQDGDIEGTHRKIVNVLSERIKFLRN